MSLRNCTWFLCLLLVVACGFKVANFNAENPWRGKTLKVLTLNHPLIYQKDRAGGKSGIDHDLLQNFAEKNDLQLVFETRANEKELFESLARNEGDLIAARWPTKNILLQGFIPGPAYEETRLSLFCQKKLKVQGFSELRNHKLAWAKKDHAPDIQSRMQLLMPELQIEVLDANAKKVLYQTAHKKFDCALAEDLEGTYLLRLHPSLVKVGPVTETFAVSWVLRPEHQSLQDLMSRWFQASSRQDQITRIQDRYRTYIDALKPQDVARFTQRMKSLLPPYEKSFKSAARYYKLDWRLLGSIAFQESHWDASAVSYTGVKGLMQLTLGTAALAGIQDRTDPHDSIWGGAYFVNYLWKLIPKTVPYNDRIALTLACYNMGYGHLKDAQKLVLKQGRDPYSWRDIKAVLPLLADPAYADQLEYGPSRGYETLEYVERVRGYYSLWKSLDTSS